MKNSWVLIWKAKKITDVNRIEKIEILNKCESLKVNIFLIIVNYTFYYYY